MINFFIYVPAIVESMSIQNVTILIVYANNATLQLGVPHYSNLLKRFSIIGPSVSHSPTKHDSTLC